MSRVAIIGSCITRDLWPIRGDGVEGLLYVSRTSLTSLFSPPVAGFRPKTKPPAGLTKYQHRAIVSDLTKDALAALVAHRPTHLIFDFIDERFDLLSAGGGLATRSWELEQSGYLETPALKRARPIPRLSDGCERLWMDAAGEMAAFLRATRLSEATLILHEARWAERYLDETGAEQPLRDVEVLPGRPAEIAAHNALLARYEAAFSAMTPKLVRVAAPGERMADARHQWGLSPFHYVEAYYEEIWRQLRALGV